MYMSAAPTPEEKILDFDSALAVADAFVGRETVFAALEAFRTKYDRGYFDIVAEAGLGKTALAASIARRREAICFFASANRGLKRADQFDSQQRSSSSTSSITSACPKTSATMQHSHQGAATGGHDPPA